MSIVSRRKGVYVISRTTGALSASSCKVKGTDAVVSIGVGRRGSVATTASADACLAHVEEACSPNSTCNSYLFAREFMYGTDGDR